MTVEYVTSCYLFVEWQVVNLSIKVQIISSTVYTIVQSSAV